VKVKYGWLIYWLFVAAVVFGLSLAVFGQSAEASLADCHDATCRMTSGGTGVAFRNDGRYVYVLTNAHVVDTPPGRKTQPGGKIGMIFWRAGHEAAHSVVGVVLGGYRNQEVDAAMIAVPVQSFFGQPPATIPLAPRNRVLKSGETIYTVGSPYNKWIRGIRGHAIGYSSYRLKFRPPPEKGQSGSAIFDADGEQIVGLLFASDDNDYGRQGRRPSPGANGHACAVQAIYKYFGKQDYTVDRKTYRLLVGLATLRPTRDSTQCPGGQCPQWFGGRLQQRQQLPQQQQRQGQGLYPGLPQVPNLDIQPQPQVQPLPQRPVPDQSDVLQRLDKIAEGVEGVDQKLDRLLEPFGREPAPYQLPPPPLPVPEPEPEEIVDELARTRAEEALTLATEVKSSVEVAGEDRSRLRQALDTLVGDHLTLKERFQARVEKVKEELGPDASRVDIARAYARDLAAEKLTGGAGWTMGKVLGAALGLGGPLAIAIAVAGFLIARRIGGKIEAGEPLLVQRMISHLGEKIDDLKGRLRDEEPTAKGSA